MLDFNTIGIKDTQDLREALVIEMNQEVFVRQVESMVERWSLNSTLAMLYGALYGYESNDGLIKFTHVIKDNFEKNGDPNDYWVEAKGENSEIFSLGTKK